MGNQVSTIGGAFYINGASGGVKSVANTVKWCYLGDMGGAFSIISTTFADSGSSTFTYNAALQGG